VTSIVFGLTPAYVGRGDSLVYEHGQCEVMRDHFEQQCMPSTVGFGVRDTYLDVCYRGRAF